MLSAAFNLLPVNTSRLAETREAQDLDQREKTSNKEEINRADGQGRTTIQYRVGHISYDLEKSISHLKIFRSVTRTEKC